MKLISDVRKVCGHYRKNEAVNTKLMSPHRCRHPINESGSCVEKFKDCPLKELTKRIYKY
jgi:hypothetical protein